MTRGTAVLVLACLAVPVGARAAARTPGEELVKAASQGSLEKVRALLASGAPVDAQDKDGKTALWEAARHDKPDIVALLIQHQARLELADKGGDTPLWQAARKGSPRVMDLLLRAGALGRTRGPNGETLLMAAAAGGAGALQRALDLGLEVDGQDASGETALFYAARGGSGPAIEALVAAHAQVDIFSARNLTPLMVAAQGSHEDAVRALLAAGAAPDLRNERDKDWTALMYASKSGTGAVVDVLAAAGAYVDAEDGAHDMPIHIAARFANASALRALLGRGSHVNRPSGYDRKTPLEIAVEGSDWDPVAALVEFGACVPPGLRERAEAKKNEKMAAALSGGRSCHHR